MRTAVLCAALRLLSGNSASCHLGFILRCRRQGQLLLDAAVVALKRRAWMSQSRREVPHGRTNCISGSPTQRFMQLEPQGPRTGKWCFCMACFTQAFFMLAMGRRAKIDCRRRKGMVSQVHKMPSTLPKHIKVNFM